MTPWLVKVISFHKKTNQGRFASPSGGIKGDEIILRNWKIVSCNDVENGLHGNVSKGSGVFDLILQSLHVSEPTILYPRKIPSNYFKR